MPNEPTSNRQTQEQRDNEYMRGGKGRKDEVGGSGIYPASAPDIPKDAEVRRETDLVRHGAVRTPATKDQPKSDQSSGSE